MRCPYCNSTDSRVTDSRPDIEDAIIRRRRVCEQCGAKFTTVERIQMRDLMVRKNSGKLEAFDREKLRRSIKLACRNRDVGDEQIEKLVTSIHRRLETESPDETVTSAMVGQMVSDSLLNLDPIAFVRFVSVYRKFSRISDFKRLSIKYQKMRKMQLYVNCQRLRCSDTMKKIFAFFIALFIPHVVWAVDLPQVLTDVDASLYQQIFVWQDKEKINTAINVQGQIADDLLMNEVLYQRYISDTYHTRGREIAAWMDKYYNMPGAKRMEKLAKIKKASVRKASVPNMISGSESIDTAQSETWTVKKYSGKTDKKIGDFKRAIRTGSTKVARQILEDKTFKNQLTESDYGRL
ncbi:MAG: transcriptional repressor NrdR, partial [Alphaproteobacteria bacterium]|nr:transcriptional repressor NrdR [Alphaproteobacteria bacterium]